MSKPRKTTCSAVALSLGLLWCIGCASLTLRSRFALEILPESIEIPGFLAEIPTLEIPPLEIPALKKGRYYTLDHLWEEYLSGVDHRLLAPRNGQQLLESRHRQYNAACGLFSVAMITEYLGFAHFEEGAHLDFEMEYGDFSGATIDVGYFGSPEHLSADYTAWTARSYGKIPDYPGVVQHVFGHDPPGPTCGAYFSDGSTSDAVPVQFRGTRDLPLYGFCGSRTDRVPAWLNRVHMPWRRTTPVGMKPYLNTRTLVGCNDATPLNVKKASINDQRRILKEFIDRNLPVITSSRNGQHFLVVVGYAELDRAGLPRAVIASNPTLTVDASFGNTPVGRLPGPRPKFWVFRNLDEQTTWNDGWSSLSAFFGFFGGVLAWNQHLDGGCGEDGWATRLDRQLEKKGLLCGDLAPDEVRCSPPWFGYEVACLDEKGLPKLEYFADPSEPFLVEPQRSSCHRVAVTLRDGSPSVQSAEVFRYGYDPEASRWIELSHWPADKISSADHLAGRRSTAIWDTSWKDGFWWSADDLTGDLTRRRVTFRLDLGGGITKTIEVSPPGTYGLTARCSRAGSTAVEIAAEASRAAAAARFALLDAPNSDCDAIELDLRLGDGVSITAARLSSYRRGGKGPWEKEVDASADKFEQLTEGLSGASYRATWNAGWPDGRRWVMASGKGGSRMRTEFELTMTDGSRRFIALLPMSAVGN